MEEWTGNGGDGVGCGVATLQSSPPLLLADDASGFHRLFSSLKTPPASTFHTTHPSPHTIASHPQPPPPSTAASPSPHAVDTVTSRRRFTPLPLLPSPPALPRPPASPPESRLLTRQKNCSLPLCDFQKFSSPSTILETTLHPLLQIIHQQRQPKQRMEAPEQVPNPHEIAILYCDYACRSFNFEIDL
nr:hypothetical protein Iba_chr13cCG15600 [Ipomoea batatas]